MDFNLDKLEKIHDFMMMTFSEGAMTEEECLKEIQDVITHSKKRKRSSSWDCLKNMPPLYHKLPDQDFDLEKSEVLKFIGSQKEAINWLMMSARKNNYLTYNPELKKWQGVDYTDD